FSTPVKSHERMTERPQGSLSSSMEAFLSGAYRRIIRITIFLTVAATVAATALFSWRAGVGIASGSLLAGLNFGWVHHGTELMIRRMVNPGKAAPSKLRLMLAFVGRYVCVIAAAYVILKSYPRMLEGFIAGLAFPILAAMSEGVYEAVVSSRNDQTPD